MIKSNRDMVIDQLHLVVGLIEGKTIIDDATEFQAQFGTYKDQSGWTIRFPANPVGTDVDKRPYISLRWLRENETLNARFRQPALNYDGLEQQNFYVDLNQEDAERMFPQVSSINGSKTRSLVEWALERYDTLHIQQELGLPSILQPAKPVKPRRQRALKADR